MGLNVQIWAMGEALDQKELDWFTLRKVEKRMDLEGKRRGKERVTVGL